MPPPRNNPERALVHPAWWLSLAVMAFNDHVLKAADLLPGAVTGKLSDLSGMMVAPVLLAALVRARSRWALIACHAAVGLVFGAIQLSRPAADLWSAMMGLVGAPWVIVSDPTDLMALPVLWLSWRVLVPAMQTDDQRARQGLETLLAAIGLLFCIATSKADECAETNSCGCPDLDGDGYCGPYDCDDNDPSVGSVCCVDVDGDGVCADSDCDDHDSTRSTGCCIDLDGDGVCATFDCDDEDPNLWDCCIDADGDGVCAADDCDDQNPYVFDCSCAGASPLVLGAQVGDTSSSWTSRELACAGLGAGVLFQHQVTGESLRWITLSFEAEGPHALAVGDDCELDAPLACLAPATAHSTSLLAVAGTSFFAYLQPASLDDAGPFTLTLSDEPLVCGDGLVVGPEACDDGNQIDGDGCDASCQYE